MPLPPPQKKPRTLLRKNKFLWFFVRFARQSLSNTEKIDCTSHRKHFKPPFGCVLVCTLCGERVEDLEALLRISWKYVLRLGYSMQTKSASPLSIHTQQLKLTKNDHDFRFSPASRSLPTRNSTCALTHARTIQAALLPKYNLRFTDL